MTRGRRGHRPAFSLVEVVLSVLLLGGVMAAVLNTVGATATIRRLDMDRVRGQALAMDLVDEIVAKPYDDPDGAGTTLGPDSTETARSLFDDVDDYAGWSASPPQLADGSAIPGLSGWTREAAVVWVSDSNLAAASLSETGVKRIRVVVRHGERIVATVEALRTSAMDSLR